MSEGTGNGKRLHCPICKAETSDKYRPFCSKRCADIDLGRWIQGAYAIPSTSDDDDEDGADSSPQKARQEPPEV